MTAMFDVPTTKDLLLIEDDDGLRRALHLLLVGQGYSVHAFARADLVRDDRAALSASRLVIDYVLPGTDGIAALGLLRECGWSGRAILVSAFLTPEVRVAAREAGFHAALTKPFRDGDLLGALSPSRIGVGHDPF